MHKLFKEIAAIIEEHDHLNINNVADYIGCTKQQLSDCLKNGVGIGFRKLLRMSFLLFPKTQKKVMDNWCLRLNTTESIKQGFEYASITRNIELLKKMIDLHKDEKGALGKYVSVYSILYDFYVNKIGAKDLIHRLEKVGQAKDELGILSEIIKCYNYYYHEKFHLMLETAQNAEQKINALSERHLFIKECYLHRISEVLGHVSLNLNDIDSARYYASIIINANICAKTVSGAYYILGMTYLSEDKTKCLENLQARYDIAKTLGEQDIENNARRGLDFAKLFHDVQLDTDSDPILLKLQVNKGSEFELKMIKEAVFKQGDEDILTLMGAIAKNSINSLYDCRKKFRNQKNYFFASLTAKELLKRGEVHPLLDEAISDKIETKGGVYFEKTYIKCFNSSRSNCGFSIA